MVLDFIVSVGKFTINCVLGLEAVFWKVWGLNLNTKMNQGVSNYFPPPFPRQTIYPPPLFQNLNYLEMAILAVIQDNSGRPAAGGKF